MSFPKPDDTGARLLALLATTALSWACDSRRAPGPSSDRAAALLGGVSLATVLALEVGGRQDLVRGHGG